MTSASDGERRYMTEELNNLTPKELKKLKEGISIVKKVYGVTDKDIDMALKYVKCFETLFGIVKRQQVTLNALSDAVGKKADEDMRKEIEKAEKELAQAPLFMDLGNV